jgi:superfamily I DNA and/or RNA helicase/very-short-patch-repair endonuclease
MVDSKNNNQENSSIKFVKEVAKYFMEFLDTDFKKSRIPKRNTINNTQNGLKVGINLKKYPKLKNTLLGMLNSGFNKDELKIKKGDYTCKIPQTFLTLITKKINDITEEEIETVINEIQKLIEENALKYSKEYNYYLEETKEQTKSILSKFLILPFLNDLDKPLEDLDIADENSRYQLEIDIVDSVFSIFEEKFVDILEDAFKNPNNKIIKESLFEIIKLPEIKDKLINFVSNIVIGDVFYDIYQLYRNLSLIDKTEIYVYFYEIALGKSKFPIFYIPINIRNDEKVFSMQFEKRLFINTKAINYVVQEYNIQTERKSTLAGEFDRILYLNESDVFHIIDNTIKKITNFFEFNKTIDINKSEYQNMGNLIFSLSNNLYLYLFDKSDESLINDYEEIINNDGEIIENFSTLIEGFIEDNPKPYMEEVDEEWQETSIPKRLVFESPIPLNTEQKQVLIALKKSDCKFLILEGPPGTGKSHTITAIICKAILEGKSVLVLSDKKEALDVVEEKISSTLNKIRGNEVYQNPILRLGGTGNKFNSIVQGQSLDKIRNFYFTYKHNEEEHEKEIKKTLSELEENIEENIKHYQGINFKDIEYYFKNGNRFSKIDWIDDTVISDLTINDFLRIKKCIQKMQNYKDCSFKTAFIKEENLQILKNLYVNLTELEKLKKPLRKINNYQKLLERFSELNKNKKDYFLKILQEVNDLFIFYSEKWDTSEFSYFNQINSELYISKVLEKISIIEDSENFLDNSLKYLENQPDTINLLKNFIIPEEHSVFYAITKLDEFIKKIKELQRPVIGFLFKNDKINELSRNFKKTFHFFNIKNPQKKLNKILNIYDLFEFIYAKLYENNNLEELFRNTIHLLIQSSSNEDVKEIYNENKSNLYEFADKLKQFEELPDIKINELQTYISLFKLLNIKDNIQSEFSQLKNKDLKLDISFEHILFENTEMDILYINSLIKLLEELLKFKEDFHYIEQFQRNNPAIAERIGLDIFSKNINCINCVILDYDDDFINEYFKFKQTEIKLKNQFNDMPEDIYSDSIVKLEDLITAKMTYFLDRSVIEYTDKFRPEVETLRSIIRKKEKFPKGLFQNLRKAFPCILSGIRDYAEYIPLEKDLFDLIIIDEASQVSIAQALPAIIRGKQLVVLGDDRQFSNVKAHNASNVINSELKQKVQKTFYNEVINREDNFGWMTKVKENFDIKKSILKFLRFIRNYECMLKKHFRCYPEIISYSDEHFYGSSLQYMKIRGKPIKEVIKFEFIDHDGKIDDTKNTNELESDFIISQLKEFQKNNFEQSIGIITPHREQVTLLFDKISDLSISDWLFEKCKLKIMTFDTCQGEERDYIFYSMVATREKDRLNWIFPKYLNPNYNSIKQQRLNVGFSRAKETIHFVLSKNIEEYQYEIKKVLKHYKGQLDNSKEIIIGGTDKNSPMEKEIQKYFYQTLFYKNNRDKIELIPQFSIGEYLKQIDKDYNHPEYKVDFLLIYENTQKIIIEYDGFREHFDNLGEVNKSNYRYYLKDSDINRQKILEGYGYKFLRINKFNIGKDPVETLNQRLEKLVKKK